MNGFRLYPSKSSGFPNQRSRSDTSAEGWPTVFIFCCFRCVQLIYTHTTPAYIYMIIYVATYVCVCKCMHIYIHLYTYVICIHLETRMHPSIPTYLFAYIHTNMHKHPRTYMRTCIHPFILTHISIQVYTCTYILHFTYR